MLARIRKATEEREGGFTLIELLVVIIIIGILAAIAIPVFLNQRSKGYDAQSKSDLRNFATQEETYFVHHGEVEFRFGDGSTHRVGPGGLDRVDPSTHRSVRNVGDADAILVVAGGKDGYVGRDGQAVGRSGGDGPPGAA